MEKIIYMNWDEELFKKLNCEINTISKIAYFPVTSLNDLDKLVQINLISKHDSITIYMDKIELIIFKNN